VVLRIGINTGPVVAAVNPGRDFLVTGETVTLAARLQQAAEPGEILVGERTFRALEPIIRTARPRSLRVKGRSGPVTAYAVEGIAPAAAYRRRRRAQGPFVGREDELTLLRSLVDRAVTHSRAHLVTVMGEPGIGKTRLAEELVIELQRTEEPPRVWVGRCRPYGESGPYAPLRDVLVRSVAGRPQDPPDELRDRIAGHLVAVLGDEADETIAEVLRTLDLEPEAGPARARAEDEDGGRVRRDAWREVLLGLARDQPTLLVLEDAHWAEPALLDLLEALVAGTARVPLVVLCLAREELLETRPAWGAGVRNSTVVTLDALSDEEARRLALALTHGAAPPDAVIARAGGNPFFLEEVLAIAGERVAGVIPETVQGVIAARLDLLPTEEKRLLQRASVIGRDFTAEALDAVSVESVPVRLLHRLGEREFLVPRGPTYSFKHTLTRDVAYESVPRTERARLHLRLARWLEGQPDSSRQVVANHYATAVNMGATECRADAVRLLLEASREAADVYAHGLALRQAQLALTLAATDEERAYAYEDVGDAHWISESGDDAWMAYASALEHGERAGLELEDRIRLAWKWVDVPTRWGGILRNPPARDEVHGVLERGLADARAAGSAVMQARFLVAQALDCWRHETDGEVLARGLADADEAVRLAEEAGRASVLSAALDARAALLAALNRYADARRVADRRFDLIPQIPHREEQLDACSAAAWMRAMAGDYAGAVAAADRAEEIAAGSAGHWLGAPATGRVDAYFLWDRWDDALAAYERFLEVYRSTGRRGHSPAASRATAVAVAIHLLRGDVDGAERLEQRSGSVPASTGSSDFHLLIALGLLGRGEPDLALDRLATVERLNQRTQRPFALATRAEAEAMLARWDDLDRSLGAAAECEGLSELPRASAQVDRARGIAGDGIALARAAEAFKALGCRFEHARCLALEGRTASARRVFEQMGAEPALTLLLNERQAAAGR
jgi:tetratricopeptide (TPR) repeat protein